MIRLLNTASSRALDRFTVGQGQLTEVDLMRNAGRAVAIEAGKLLRGARSRGILVVCGKGHNGGDGIAAAGFLASWGYGCTVVLVGQLEDLDSVVKATYEAAQVQVMESARPNESAGAREGLVIDALLGVGVSRPLRGPVAGWAKAINDHPGVVLSVDLPTGLSADTGETWEGVVHAEATVTMGHPKLGLLVNTGPDVAGRVVVADIGFSSGYINKNDHSYYQFTREDFARQYNLPPRQTFKHRQGKTLVVAGSRDMTGAAVLAARATILSGSGLTVAACPASIQQFYALAMPEVMTLGLEDNRQGMFLPEHVTPIRESLASYSAVVLGPGLSRRPQVQRFVRKIFEHLDLPTLLDADGLAPFYGAVDLLNAAEMPLVLTPHAREFADLFDHDLKEVMTNPVKALSEVRAYFPHTVVLKGAPTMTLLSSGDIVVNSTGNPGMATAGSGDVLSGIIGTLLSQGQVPDDAAMMGVWIHGRAGDLARQRYGASGMTSLHILEQLPHALKEFDPLS